MGITAATLFVTGIVVSLFTGRAPLWSGLRMVLVAATAAAITYGVGRLFGVALS